MYYVTSEDTFMSGWGHAEGKINVLIFECDSMAEAQIVSDNANNRTDQENVKIHDDEPYFSSSDYYEQTKTKEDYSAWYQEGFFAK